MIIRAEDGLNTPSQVSEHMSWQVKQPVQSSGCVRMPPLSAEVVMPALYCWGGFRAGGKG